MIEFKGSHFEREVLLWGIRWHVAYPISGRRLEEMIKDGASRLAIPRSIAGWSSTSRYWTINFAPASGQLAPAGEWTRDMPRSKAPESVCVGQSTRRAARWTSC